MNYTTQERTQYGSVTVKKHANLTRRININSECRNINKLILRVESREREHYSTEM